jgi:hypothetical protein
MESTLKVFQSLVVSWPYVHTLDRAGKACQGSNTLTYSAE